MPALKFPPPLPPDWYKDNDDDDDEEELVDAFEYEFEDLLVGLRAFCSSTERNHSSSSGSI